MSFFCNMQLYEGSIDDKLSFLFISVHSDINSNYCITAVAPTVKQKKCNLIKT